MFKNMFAAFNIWVICRSIENIVMTVGIVYAACFFKKYTLLWFLLLPVLNQVTFRGGNNNNSKEDEKNA